MEEILFTLFNRFGLVAATTMTVALILWRSARWFSQKVGEPLIASHTGLVRNVQDINVMNADTNRMNATIQSTQTEVLKDIRHTLIEQNELLLSILKQRLVTEERERGR